MRGTDESTNAEINLLIQTFLFLKVFPTFPRQRLTMKTPEQ